MTVQAFFRPHSPQFYNENLQIRWNDGFLEPSLTRVLPNRDSFAVFCSSLNSESLLTSRIFASSEDCTEMIFLDVVSVTDFFSMLGLMLYLNLDMVWYNSWYFYPFFGLLLIHADMSCSIDLALPKCTIKIWLNKCVFYFWQVPFHFNYMSN